MNEKEKRIYERLSKKKGAYTPEEIEQLKKIDKDGRYSAQEIKALKKWKKKQMIDEPWYHPNMLIGFLFFFIMAGFMVYVFIWSPIERWIWIPIRDSLK